MDFFSYLDHLRQKPEYVRKNIAFWTAASVAFIIFLIWLSFLALSPVAKPQQVQTPPAETKGIVETIGGVVERFQLGIEAVINQFR